jgi:probable F420-dependent oxidoreductase
MEIGVLMFPTDDAIAPAELARAVEERGFESLWVPEHTHIPSSRKSAWPGGPELPRHYVRTYDPFVALSMAAAVTTTLKLGTGVCLVVERDPIVTAKAVASLDYLSSGRFLFGIGGGWNIEEMENHGTDSSTRFALLRERMEAMKEIWTKDEATYHGTFVNFDAIWAWPKPKQTPHPPILMGGDGPNTLDRVVRYADEWLPIPGRGAVPFSDRITELQDKAAAAGRAPIPVGVFGAPADAAKLTEYVGLGVNRCLLNLPSAPADVVLPILDQYRTLMNSLG